MLQGISFLFKMRIFVATVDGNKSLYETNRFCTVHNLKLQIGRVMGVPMGFGRLFFNGKQLSNNSVLNDLGIKHMSTVYVIWRPVIITPKKLLRREIEPKRGH